MCVMNTDSKARLVDITKYDERTHDFKGGIDIIAGNKIGTQFSIQAMTMQVIELTK